MREKKRERERGRKERCVHLAVEKGKGGKSVPSKGGGAPHLSIVTRKKREKKRVCAFIPMGGKDGAFEKGIAEVVAPTAGSVRKKGGGDGGFRFILLLRCWKGERKKGKRIYGKKKGSAHVSRGDTSLRTGTKGGGTSDEPRTSSEGGRKKKRVYLEEGHAVASAPSTREGQPWGREAAIRTSISRPCSLLRFEKSL